MIVSCILAVSENGVIGRAGDLPWHLPADLRRFKALTMGHPIVMGRRTYESVGRLLPGRTTVVLSRDPGYEVEGAVMARSLDDALERLSGEEEVFIVGGEAVFREALPRARRLYLTRVHARVEGDVFFPEDELERWELRSDEPRPADEEHRHPYSFRVYERPRGADAGE
ncbi:MAG: dihydrofolate reductase [Planctomycetota bacterium]|nr:dihydrofolate reductase [Planctomycetota bacterium]